MVRARRGRPAMQQRALNGFTTSSLIGTVAINDNQNTSCDSPKRKDCKLDNVIQKRDGPTTHMVLRRPKCKDQEITKYFTSSIPYKTQINNINDSEKVIDLTDDSATDLFNKSFRHDMAMKRFRSQFLNNKFDLTEECDLNKQNIFLQEPVLSLNIDKSPNQASSFVIKNSFFDTAEHNKAKFSPPLVNSSNEYDFHDDAENVDNKNEYNNGNLSNENNHGEVKLTDSALDLSQPTQVTDIDSTTFFNSDSNSCDSGVVADKISELSPNRKKPTTPHRIVCHSPMKTQLTVNAASNNNNNNNINVNNNLEKNKLKSIPKTKRRILVQFENISDKNKQQQPQPKNCVPKNKPVLNSHINPTAEENTTNNTQSGSNVNNTKNSSNDNCPKTKLTDFFPVRRSVRKTKKTVQEEILRNIQNAIRSGREDGLAIKCFGEKGRGVVTKRPFAKGEFVIEYIGDLISIAEANRREQLYAEDDNTGCFMYYFKHNDQQYCIDATEETGKIGRLVNHSRNGNLLTKTIILNKRPHLVLIAKEDIDVGEELTYDYGDRSKESLQNHPWLAL